MFTHPWPDVRVACVWLPHLPLRVEVLRHPAWDGLPLVLGGAPGERKVVHLCSPEAEAAGIRPGLPLREVRAAVPRGDRPPARPGAASPACSTRSSPSCSGSARPSSWAPTARCSSTCAACATCTTAMSRRSSWPCVRRCRRCSARASAWRGGKVVAAIAARVAPPVAACVVPAGAHAHLPGRAADQLPAELRPGARAAARAARAAHHRRAGRAAVLRRPGPVRPGRRRGLAARPAGGTTRPSSAARTCRRSTPRSASTIRWPASRRSWPRSTSCWRRPSPRPPSRDRAVRQVRLRALLVGRHLLGAAIHVQGVALDARRGPARAQEQARAAQRPAAGAARGAVSGAARIRR